VNLTVFTHEKLGRKLDQSALSRSEAAAAKVGVINSIQDGRKTFMRFDLDCSRYMGLIIVLFGTFFAASTVAQNPVIVTSIPGPPALVSAATVHGAFAKAEAMWPTHVSDIDAAYLTRGDLGRLVADQPLLDQRYVLIMSPTQDQFRFASEQTFQSIVQKSRPRTFNQSMAIQANASFKSQSMDVAISNFHEEQVVLDENDHFAKILVTQYNIAGKELTFDALTAYVRLNGQLFVIDATAPDDNASDRRWLREKVVSWVRSLR